mmetsp:Transcript_121350/g.329450  ORF Transcript_121350/g.329450 Transcript_121350/m.329450 type:complete len:202 (+) Transcript_121350:365-970(+)
MVSTRGYEGRGHMLVVVITQIADPRTEPAWHEHGLRVDHHGPVVEAIPATLYEQPPVQQLVTEDEHTVDCLLAAGARPAATTNHSPLGLGWPQQHWPYTRSNWRLIVEREHHVLVAVENACPHVVLQRNQPPGRPLADRRQRKRRGAQERAPVHRPLGGDGARPHSWRGPARRETRVEQPREHHPRLGALQIAHVRAVWQH